MNLNSDANPVVGLNSSTPKCGCGRSPNGMCVGWHNLNEEQYKFMFDLAKQMQYITPTHNPEQDWTVEERIAGLK
jgi:hypothetical protein